MKQYKRKFGIYAAWNYGLKIEALNKLSEKGWQLIKGGIFSDRFKREEAVKYRYQMDFQPQIEEKGRYIETFREQGWEYVNSTVNGWHYFRKLYDAERPEREYEIFTDTESLKEMNNRWAIVGMLLAAIFGYGFVRQAVTMILWPNMRTLFQMVYLGFILAVFIRGVIVMRNPKKPKDAMLDKILIVVLLVWMIGGARVGSLMVENRPTFNLTNMSAEYAPISADLEDATEWLAFDVKYEDNYYMDIEAEVSAPLCFSVVSETDEIIYKVNVEKYEEDNIRLHLKQGKYSIYFSDFTGGSIHIKAAMR